MSDLARELEQFGHSHAKDGNVRTAELLFRASRRVAALEKAVDIGRRCSSKAGRDRIDAALKAAS